MPDYAKEVLREQHAALEKSHAGQETLNTEVQAESDFEED